MHPNSFKQEKNKAIDQILNNAVDIKYAKRSVMCRISLVNLEKSLTPEMCMLTILKATKDFSMLNIENINETKVKVGNL